MRLFEILILSTLFVSWVGVAFPPIKRSSWIVYIPGLGILLTLIHLGLEKFRWQMLPAYALVLIVFFLSLRRLRSGRLPSDVRPPRRFNLILGLIFRLLVFTLLAALPVLIPVFRLPEPTGEYPVGTAMLHLVDDSRPETLTPDPDDYRELMVRVWYPARVESGARLVPLMEHAPPQFAHLSLVRTHAYQDVSVSDARSSYPVLIFSHGHVGFIEQNLTQMEELASHGYIVFSMAHPYHTIETVFPDGRVVPADSGLANDFLQGISPAPGIYAEHLRIWTEDTRFLIDQLERFQAGKGRTIFVGKLDMTRLGIFGQSFGGVTAVQVCSLDDRCRAGINLDAGLPGDYTARTRDLGLDQPFMFMLNQTAAYNRSRILKGLEGTVYVITVRGTTHFDFTDLALYSPVLKFTRAFGPIDGHRMVEIINAYTLAFFDRYLKGESAPLIDGPSPDYPEVTIEMRSP